MIGPALSTVTPNRTDRLERLAFERSCTASTTIVAFSTT